MLSMGVKITEYMLSNGFVWFIIVCVAFVGLYFLFRTLFFVNLIGIFKRKRLKQLEMTNSILNNSQTLQAQTIQLIIHQNNNYNLFLKTLINLKLSSILKTLNLSMVKHNNLCKLRLCQTNKHILKFGLLNNNRFSKVYSDLDIILRYNVLTNKNFLFIKNNILKIFMKLDKPYLLTLIAINVVLHYFNSILCNGISKYIILIYTNFSTLVSNLILCNNINKKLFSLFNLYYLKLNNFTCSFGNMGKSVQLYLITLLFLLMFTPIKLVILKNNRNNVRKIILEIDSLLYKVMQTVIDYVIHN